MPFVVFNPPVYSDKFQMSGKTIKHLSCSFSASRQMRECFVFFPLFCTDVLSLEEDIVISGTDLSTYFNMEDNFNNFEFI